MEPRNKNLSLAGLILIGLGLRLYSMLQHKEGISGTSWLCLALFVLILLLVYRMSRIITDSETASLFAVLLAIAVPIYSWRTVSQLKVIAHSEVPESKIIKVTSLIGGRS
jgi:hypothetical protein